MASKYFSFIQNELRQRLGGKGDDEDKARLELYYIDIEFIFMFCCCLENWIDSDDVEEQIKETLRCMISHLKLIWLGETQNLETWPQKKIKDLELKIEESKLQVENWCDKLVCSHSHSPLMMHYCKPSSSSTDYYKIEDFITSVIINQKNLHRYKRNVPFKNQINILKDMLEKMEYMLQQVCGYFSSKELVEYLSFVVAFSNNAAILTCLYWLNPENDQTATQLNIAFFYLLHNIKSCASHVTPCYIHLLNSNNKLLQSYDSVFEADIPASIVALFFENTLLEDDFLFLRQRLDFLDLYEMEIRFLRSLFFQCFETWDDSHEETRIHMHSVVTSLQRIWGNEYDMGLLSARLYAIRKADWEEHRHLLDLELKEKLHMSKQEINAWLVSCFHCSFHCRPSTSTEIVKFLDSILHNMSDLFSSRACKDAAFKKQTKMLKEKLLLVKNFLKLAKNCAYSKNLEDFNMLAQVFANNAACLVYHYWAKEANDAIPTETNRMLSNMLQQIKPNTPHVARMYIGTLKAICSQPFDFFLLEQTATSFVDYFFEYLGRMTFYFT